jgi:hypothetical protein
MSIASLIQKTLVALAVSGGCGVALAGPIMHIHDGARLATLDVANGAVNIIGGFGTTITDIAFDPLGNLYGLSFTNLYSINKTSGATTLIGSHGISGGNALVFGANGTLYGAGNGTTNLFSISTATGAGTSLGSMRFRSGGDLAFNGGNFFLASSGSQLVKIDLGNLANSAAVGSFGVGNTFGIATGSDGILYSVADNTVYKVNTATGAATSPVSFARQGLRQVFGESFFGEAGVPVPVPEPDVLALLSIGLIGLSRLGTKRRS